MLVRCGRGVRGIRDDRRRGEFRGAASKRCNSCSREAATHRLVITSGSTGQLYAQITNGAPFDVLLSADREHVDMLLAAGLGDGEQHFTYAIGKLALWTRDVEKFEPLALTALSRSDYRWLAIANPELAPYGLAAEQTLRKLGLWEALQIRIVRGQSIAQTFAMAETRNADLAFVALSQVVAYAQTGRTSRGAVGSLRADPPGCGAARSMAAATLPRRLF